MYSELKDDDKIYITMMKTEKKGIFAHIEFLPDSGARIFSSRELEKIIREYEAFKDAHKIGKSYFVEFDTDKMRE